MILTHQNYAEFCKAFDALVILAKNDDDIFDYVYNLHNQITNGATKRIFNSEALPLANLQVSPMNFARFISQNNDKIELKNLLFMA